MTNNNKLFWEINSQNILNSLQSRVTPPITYIEKEYILDFNQKEILHLFCNFGLTSFYLENLGGRVTGVDYNEYAISYANIRKSGLGSEVNFICSDFFELDNKKSYDIIYGSYGVLDWVENIDTFINKIDSLLKTEGRFIFIEYHSDLFKLKFEQLNGIKISENQYKIPTNYIHRTNEHMSSLMGGGFTKEESVYMYPFLHNTDIFLNKLNNAGFRQKKLNFYDHINFKMGHSTTIGSNMYRNAFLKDGEYMCYGIEYQKV